MYVVVKAQKISI